MKLFGMSVIGGKALDRLYETMNEYRRTLEDLGWINLSTENQNGTFNGVIASGFRNMIKRCRIYFFNNALAGQWVNLTTSFTFGKGISAPKGNDDSITEEVKRFWDDEDNKKAFTGTQAQVALSNKLQYEGNIFLALFEGNDGDVKVRVFDTMEIDDIITDPEDRQNVLVYKQTQRQRRFDFLSDTWSVDSSPRFMYYADYKADPEKISKLNIPQDKFVENIRVYHAKINCDINDKFGIPDLYRGLDWMKAHKDMAGDLATLIKSLSSIAWKKKVKGTPAKVASLKAAFQAKTDLSNPAATAGSTQYENEGINLEAINIPTGGAKIGADGLRQMLLGGVCPGSGVFEHYFGNPDSGNLATTTSMELPMIKKFELRQEIWANIFNDIIQYQIQKKIEVGLLSKDVDRFIDIDFPPIIERAIDLLANALQIGVMNKLISNESAAKMFMLSLGINNIEEELQKIEEEKAAKAAAAPSGQQDVGSVIDEKKCPTCGWTGLASELVDGKCPMCGSGVEDIHNPEPMKEALPPTNKKMPARLANKKQYVLERMNGYHKALAGNYRNFVQKVKDSVRADGEDGQVAGNIENLDGILKTFSSKMQSSAERYFPIAVDIGKKFLQSHLSDLKVKESLFEASGKEKSLLQDKLEWNQKYVEESLIPDISKALSDAMKVPYVSEAEFNQAVDKCLSSFEGRMAQYAGAFWHVEEAAVKEAGKGTGLMANFVGADDSSTCEGCQEAMAGNPWPIDEVPEPGSHACDGNCFTDPRTRVVTEHGWKRISDIAIGEKVLSHTGKFRKVTGIINKKFDGGDIFKISVKGSNLKRWFGWSSFKNKLKRGTHSFFVTGDHEFMINGAWTRANEITKGQKIAIMAKRCKECGEPFAITKESLYSEVCSNSCATKHYKKYMAVRTEEARIKISRASKNRFSDPAERERVSNQMVGIMRNPLRKDINRQALLKRWKNSISAAVMLKALKKGRLKNMSGIETSIERKMSELLDVLKIKYSKQFPIGNFICDFYLPKLNIVIEADGDYYHSLPGAKERDARKDEYLKSLGYKVMRFGESVIKKDIVGVKNELVTVFANHEGNYILSEGEVTQAVKVKTAPDRLYCLQVETDNSFIVNRGIVSHNCRHAIQIIQGENKE